MVHKVFFSFHYERDNWRAGQVRNSGITKSDVESAGFIDAVEWESIQREGDKAIESWIEKQMEGTAVTVVLIGAQTANRRWVLHEIKRSAEKGNGLLGIYIHNVKDMEGKKDSQGKNPFTECGIEDVPIYDWAEDNGYENFGKWVEAAYQKALPKAGKAVGAGAGAAIGAPFGLLGVVIGAAVGYLFGNEVDKESKG